MKPSQSDGPQQLDPNSAKKSREFKYKDGFQKNILMSLWCKLLGISTRESSGINNIESSHFVQGLAKNAYICRNLTKKLPIISVRDIVEKKFIIRINNNNNEDETIIFTSSVPDSFYPIENEVVRATNLFCCIKISPCADGRTMYKSFAQIDPNFFFNVFPIFKRFCGVKTKEWYDSVTGYMDKIVESQE